MARYQPAGDPSGVGPENLRCERVLLGELAPAHSPGMLEVPPVYVVELVEEHVLAGHDAHKPLVLGPGDKNDCVILSESSPEGDSAKVALPEDHRPQHHSYAFDPWVLTEAARLRGLGSWPSNRNNSAWGQPLGTLTAARACRTKTGQS